MDYNLEYHYTLSPDKSLYIEDVGTACLECINEDKQLFYYMIIMTKFGKSTLFTCGPIVPDIYKIPSGYEVSMTTMDYDEDKITYAIEKFVGGKKNITLVNTISLEDAIINFRDMKEYISNFMTMEGDD